MKNQANELAFSQKRKFYLLLPIVVLPFLTWLYWQALVKRTDPREDQSTGGMQTTLPQASPKENDPVTKLEFYHKAARDSAARQQQIKKDPYRQAGLPAGADSLPSRLTGLEGSMAKGKQAWQAKAALTDADDPGGRVLKEKLAALDKALTTAQTPAFPEKASAAPAPDTRDTQDPLVRAQWEQMMNDLQTQAAEQPDPELDKLDGMLDKIIQIQDPDKKSDAATLQPSSQVFAATLAPENEPVSLLATANGDSLDSAAGAGPWVENGFFSIEKAPAPSTDGGITAQVTGEQQLVSGSIIRLRLSSPMKVAGLILAPNTPLHGTVSLAGERLRVEISSVRFQNQLLAVKLAVYDLDGMAGIYIPGALSRTVAKQSISQDVQGYDIDIAGLSPAVLAANAAMQTAKTFLSKKTRLTQVKIPDGYQVLLKDLKSPMP